MGIHSFSKSAFSENLYMEKSDPEMWGAIKKEEPR